MNKKVFKAMRLSVMAVAVVTVSSCSSDSDFFGLDGLEDMDYLNPLTNYQSEEYLDLDIESKDILHLSDEDNMIIGKALARFDIRYTKDSLYDMSHLSAEKLNMSEELFYHIKSGFEYTNSIKTKYKISKSIKRSKNRSTEYWGQVPFDCFPVAVSHYGDISLSLVYSKCDSVCSNWRTLGYFPHLYRERVITSLGLSYAWLSQFYKSTGMFNAIVTMEQGEIDHDVNGIVYYKNSSPITDYYNDIILYQDYTNGGARSGYVSVSNVWLITYDPSKCDPGSPFDN